MQVTELVNDGLKRAYAVVIPAATVLAQRDERLVEIARTLSIPGFRVGTVPMPVVRQRFGGAVLSEVVEEAVTDVAPRVVQDLGLKPALRPKIEMTALAEDSDVTFHMYLEVLPEVPMPDFSAVALERLKVEPTEDAVDHALARIAMHHGELVEVDPRPAMAGDVLVCDWVGRLPENLLQNGVGAGARPGVPEGFPREWSIHVPGGLTQDIIAIGTEGGLPYFDLAVAGVTTERGSLLVFPTWQKGVPARPGGVMTFLMTARVAKGALPDGAVAAMGFNVRSENDFIAALRAPAGLAGTDRTIMTVPDQPAVAFARPVLDIDVPAGIAVDFTLRIGPARVHAGSTEPDAPVIAGGHATDRAIEVGGPSFVPGFAEQLEGLAPGQTRDIEIAFPADYATTHMAGAHVRFAVTAKALRVRRPRAIDDDLARTVGEESLAALRQSTRESLRRDYAARARLRLKRALFDILADGSAFPVPEGMVDAEFNRIWQRVGADLKADRLEEADRGKDEETLKAEYRALAERRIRLGLLLSEIGQVNDVQVDPQEVARAVRREAMRYPGQEQRVLEFFRKNPQAVETLRLPLFEDKVVDFVLERARVTERDAAAAELGVTAA